MCWSSFRSWTIATSVLSPRYNISSSRSSYCVNSSCRSSKKKKKTDKNKRSPGFLKNTKMKKLVIFLAALLCSLAIISHTGPQNGVVEAAETGHQPEDKNSIHSAEVETYIDDELESERQLKRMLNYVTPLMEILRRNPTSSEESSARSVRKNKRKYYDLSYNDFDYDRNSFDRDSFDRNGYGGGGGYCCQQKDDLLPLLALLGLAGLLLYLIVIASTTTPAPAVRFRKRSAEENEDEGNWILTDDENIGKVTCYLSPESL